MALKRSATQLRCFSTGFPQATGRCSETLSLKAIFAILAQPPRVARPAINRDGLAGAATILALPE
jgi:hypothetical protein